MTTVLIVIHLMVVLAIIGLVLLQRSEGGALGIGGGGGGGFMTGRGAGNVLTRATGVLAAVFFATSIGLALLARLDAGPSDILDRLPAGAATSGAPSTPVPVGAPTSAEDLLRSMGGSGSAGPQAPFAADGAPAAPVPDAPSPQAAAPAAAGEGAAPAPMETATPASTPSAESASKPAPAPGTPP